jgi:hypothetical protein
VQPAPVVTPAATSSSKPLFASDEEALAAATKAYAAYLQMSDLITTDGGNDPSRIDAVADGDALASSKIGFEKFHSNGYHSVGSSKFDSFSIQQLDDSGNGSLVIRSYVCLDITGVRLVDGGGNDITAPDRENRLPLEIEIVAKRGPQSLRVNGSDSWSGKNFC